MKVRLAISFALCGLLALPALAGPASKADFAIQYATVLDLGAADAQSALQSLRDRGLVGSDFDLTGALTYGDLVDVLGRAGIEATTSVPGATVEDGVLDTVVGSLSPGLSTQGDKGDDDEREPNNNGRKRRPKGQTPNSRANPNAFYGRDEG